MSSASLEKPLFAGLDLGTSGCRLMIIDDNKVVHSSRSLLYSNPDDQSPDLWWDSVSQLLSELPAQIKQNLKSLAIDGTSGTILVCDDTGTPLSSVLMYNDLRATAEAEQIKQVLPSNNGGQGASSSLARLMWLIKHTSPPFAGFVQNDQKRGRCASTPFHAVHQADYILGKLSNDYSISDENNCLKLGYDVSHQCWPEALLSELGIDISWLPTVYPAGTVISSIDKEQGQQLGLPESLQLVTGTTDSVAAFVATGADKVGDAVTSLGSTLVLKLISDKPLFSAEHGIYSHKINNLWLVGGASNSGAKVLQYYFSQQQIDDLSAQLKPDNNTGLDYYPLLQKGERFPVADANKEAKLTPRPESDQQFFQGILEGITEIEKSGYQKLVELGASPVTSIRSVGGGSYNKLWTKMRKNVIKVDMISSAQTEAAYGSALLALQGFREDFSGDD